MLKNSESFAQPKILKGRFGMSGVKSPRLSLCSVYLALFAAFALLTTSLMFAQTTISTGSIQGTVSDPSNAMVGDAKVTITNKGTGNVITVTTSSSGTYASGALNPGEYVVRVEAKGFKTTELPITVQVNTTASGNLKLAVGEGTEVIEVQATDVGVNTEQATVQGVLNAEQIESLPINGRNFLDLAQLEPGVQIQDGGTFDPTKNGFSSVSFGGRFGRTARIEVDGIDISDETVGTTTQNIPLGAVEESALQQSSLDLSTELTSSGSVNITTKSGTNGLHGDAFYIFRDQSLDAPLPGDSTNPFQRNQFGGDVGGPIIKDKLFFFVDVERNKQDLLDPVIPNAPFNNLLGSFNSPFRETEGDGRADYSWGRYKMFYRFTYDQNKSTLPFIPNSYQPFANVNHSRNHVIGVDFNTGRYTHTIRFGYSKFENGITDAVTGSSIFDPAPGLELAIGSDANCLTAGADDFCSGPNFLAPQATMQSDHQFKYDGSTNYKNHIFRYGFGFNHIHGGGFAEFLGLAPAVGSPSNTPSCVGADNCPFSGGASNPLNYPVTNVTLGNGEGFSSEKPAFGLPGGGLGPDNRLSWYIGDAWKVKPNLTVTLGVRYVRDTGRTDSDLGADPNLAVFDNDIYHGLGNRVNQPNANFAPQVGVAWDPSGKGKTVFRGGIGLFYENSIWNNNLFDRPARLQKGLFLGSTALCQNGQAPAPSQIPFTPTIDPASICGKPIGNNIANLVTLQQEYQASVLAAGPASNGVYAGGILADGIDVTGTNLFAPNYISPRSVQMNIGVQHEIRKGTVLTVDYLRNISTHTLLTIDTNHVGDASTFNLTNANTAITNALANCGVATIVQSYSGNCPNDPTGSTDGSYGTASNPLRPANISDYGLAGLDSGYSVCGGLPCANAAFPGINKNVGANQMLFPIGRSVYNGLQTSLRQELHNPFRGMKMLNLQVSYSFSKYVSTARDNDFINFPQDNDNPLKYIGPNGLDRTHQLSFGGTAELPAHFQISLIGHFDSPLPLNLNLPVSGTAGGVFISDLTGDGTGDGTAGSNGGLGDLLPGTNIGSFGRSVKTGDLNNLINNFNHSDVGQATPAGNVLIQQHLMTLSDLQALGGVIGGTPGNGPAGAEYAPLAGVPDGAVGQAWLRTFDVSMSWAYKVKERVELRPGVSFYNIFNFSNFDGPAAPFSSTLDGSPGSPNGTTSAIEHGQLGNGLRLGLGSGVNALGSPRVMEFSLKLKF